MDLVTEIYQLTKSLPADERFGLTSQIRRSAVSIPANIAEGYGRFHRAEYLRFLSIANGSLTETETHMLIAVRLGYLNDEQTRAAWDLTKRCGQLLTKLVQALREPQSS
jgi:four helix bundle protein